ncbi:cyclopropane-fatty-acyl-phospholipid synthase [Penicillium lividum]|nr:cyclopropane-fatty-acyl-phospholipid synthase [Penicillium lividum]
MVSYMTSYVNSAIQQMVQTRIVETTKTKLQGRIQYALQYSKDGPVTYLGGPDAASRSEVLITVKSPIFWTRLLSGADLGFAESYMFQDIDCEVEKLPTLFTIVLQNIGAIRRSWLHSFASSAAQIMRRTNDAEQAQINASSHYDTSNILFSNFLSSDMSYSSAHWSSNPTETLETAQSRKTQSLLRKANISSSHHILEIGCGWGNLAIQAAQTARCRVTGITLSKEQKSWADDKIQAAGLQDRVEILLCDYRQVPPPASGTYDRIISVGMFEHVGGEYLAEYFATISRLLNPKDGILYHHIQLKFDLFILKYIFPGGYLPTIGILLNHIDETGTLEVTSAESSGTHYAKSVEEWKKNFLRNWGTIEASYREQYPQCTDMRLKSFDGNGWTPGSDLCYESLEYF